jgi:hypothetical protein
MAVGDQLAVIVLSKNLIHLQSIEVLWAQIQKNLLYHSSIPPAKRKNESLSAQIRIFAYKKPSEIPPSGPHFVSHILSMNVRVYAYGLTLQLAVFGHINSMVARDQFPLPSNVACFAIGHPSGRVTVFIFLFFFSSNGRGGPVHPVIQRVAFRH